MEPPSKRPRLSIFERSPSATELVDARYHNDLSLKSRFESIFAKYAQDFTGIGDEIDIITGRVVVNNGHLESMETETDPGLDHMAGGFSSAGRSMLRAMTVTLNPDLPGPDDVLMSIETIAENAALVDNGSTSESEDDLFELSGSRSKSRTNEVVDTSIEPYRSDSDSLFSEQRSRSGSIDSLFESATPNNEVLEDENQPLRSDPLPPVTNFDQEDEGILQKYGSYVGKEVLNLIDQRREAHIEPAWRIPVRLDVAPLPKSMLRKSTSSPADSNIDSRGRKPYQSLWRAPRPTKAAIAEQTPSREESVDPLQEDMCSEDGEMAEGWTEFDDPQSDLDYQPEAQPAQDALLRASATGDCLFCKTNFGGKSGVMAHWDRVIKQQEKRGKTDNQHDMDVIREVRSGVLHRTRLPRLVVYDFRTMVELHEGAGMSFDEIAASKTLRTRKTGLQLQEIYNKHRTPPEWAEPSIRYREWSEQEKNILQKMCENPLVTIATLRRRLKRRDELEIGNHLAECWLSQLGVDSAQATHDVDEDESIHSGALAQSTLANESSIVARQNPSKIKQEDSDDELFGQD